jgi:hypothetical protein
MLYQEKYDSNIISTNISSKFSLNSNELNQINSSLSINGIAVLNNFIENDTLIALQADSELSLNPNLDLSQIAKINIFRTLSKTTSECHHPFLLSEAAVKLVTNDFLLSVIKNYLINNCIIHHALFQKSFPLNSPAVDWHVDTGSNKTLNGNIRFPDKRLRMIVYLSNVENGGLSYCLNTREAAELFMSLPLNSNFPLNQIPEDHKRFVNINGKAGTIILFDAHGLHRPEPPLTTRTVLNTWFARTDFSGKTATNLVNLNFIPKENFANTNIFLSTSKPDLQSFVIKNKNRATIFLDKFYNILNKKVK